MGRSAIRVNPIMPELLTSDDFLPHVNKVFRVRAGHHALTLKRVDARRRDEPERTFGPRDPFNLIFRGPPGDLLREGLYLLDVEDGPSFELYVIPIQTAARDRQDYQAPFN
jgi:hypothetical protein